jgi:hypothetical protein
VFENFLSDMGIRPSGTTLDRRDNDGNYDPSNCRWVDSITQARNSKQVVWVEIDGVSKRLVEWCEELGRSVNTVRDRVKYHGMSYVEALTLPLQDKVAAAKQMTKTRMETCQHWRPKR